MISPFEGGKFRITSLIGYREHPITHVKLSPHHGLDIVGMSSKKVIAVRPGKIITSTRIYNDPGGTWQWGNYIKILSPDGISIFYCHLSQRIGLVGQTVRAGEVIGIEGTTGQSTGSHLHIEARRGTRKSMIPADPEDDCNIASILGLPNRAGIYTVPVSPVSTDYASLVAAKCDLPKEAIAYINEYRFAGILWESLWECMKNYPKRTTGSYGKDYATAVVRAAKLEWATIDYMWGCPYASDVWRKLWWQMT